MNLTQIRNETPHCKDKIFLNSAGSSLMPQCVVKTMKDYLDKEAELGGYYLADLQKKEINEFYTELAQLINCKPSNIGFCTSATDAYAKVLSSFHFAKNDVIITTDDDYVSNYIQFIALKKRFGISIRRIKNTERGDLDIDHLHSLVKAHAPRLVAVSHIPTSSGLIQNAAAVGKLCEEYGIPFLLDACQSVGQIAIDIEDLKCDFLTATGRKFLRGPRGTGFLFISDKMLKNGYAPLFLDLHGATWKDADHYVTESSAKRFEFWEMPYAQLLGLKEAVRYTNKINITEIEKRNHQLMSHFRTSLSTLKGVNLHDEGSHLGSILTFTKAEKSLEAIKSWLDRHNVFYSVSQKTSAQIDFKKKGIDWAIRLSPHYFNTHDELDETVNIIDAL